MAEEAMMQRTKDLCGRFAPAPGVTMTRLPFGGAVLIDGRTLALLECAEPDAELLAALLAAPADDRARAAPAAPLEATATRLVRDGWIVPATQDGDRR
jgi:hypothetical protein